MRQKLSFQELEGRDVPSVTAFVSNGDLYINGDAGDDWIDVTQLDYNTIRVSGLNSNTRVNGRAFADFDVSRDDIFINLGAGDDAVRVRNVRFDGFSHSDLVVDLGPGDGSFFSSESAVVQGSYFRGNISVRGSDAPLSDIVLIDTGAGGDIFLEGKSGSDSIRLIDVRAGDDVSILSGSGHDLVTLDHVRANDLLHVDLGSGNDSLTIHGSFAARPSFYGGSGNDTLNTWWGDRNGFIAEWHANSF